MDDNHQCISTEILCGPQKGLSAQYLWEAGWRCLYGSDEVDQLIHQFISTSNI